MPRQDVPYGGAICRLKERIAEIWDKLDEKLHSINGVEGDGAGDVKIVSGDAAVVISNDQIGHRIEVSLDNSKLPAASVSSVNYQTGAVRLDAADIPSDGNSNVQVDIDWSKTAINDCFDSITTEQDDRQEAEAALQTNINAVSASIPEMSMTPDPYKGVERDAQGRAFAADPESGATDKTLVTANWISQTGDSGPNNVVHRNGNETILNRKNSAFIANNFCEVDAFDTSRKGWHKIYTITSKQRWMGVLTISNVSNAYGLVRAGIKEIFIIIESESSAKLFWKTNIGANINIKLTYNGNVWEIWYNAPSYVRSYLQLDTMCYNWVATDSAFKLNPSWSDVVNEPASADYQVYIDTVENS